ncbi:S8 family peptidase [Halopolyspora algeriensis]|nr:S8 family serine peptidase [Halopolyspora algeriensis]
MRHNPLRIVGSALALSLLVPATAAGAPEQASAATAAPAHFIVLGPTGESLQTTGDSVRDTGGTVVQSWPEIGVVLATSTDPGFAEAVRDEPAVDGAGASRNLAEQRPDNKRASTIEKVSGTAEPQATIAGAEREPLESEQWDMRMIRSPKAHTVSEGSEDITVGVLDFGIDPTHPDLAPNLDMSKSVSCVDNGIPDTSVEAWAPTGIQQSHGSHVAGSIAAARNDVGIAGVAPNVKLASIRVVSDEGFIYPGAAICGFMWAAEHGIDVTNSSYYVDPWQLWCRKDPDQAAAAEAVRRAVAYAQDHDIVNVVAAGNSNWDLHKPVHDTTSPNNGGPTQDRWAGPNCAVLPGELPGVVTVSAVGPEQEKSFYSNYGIQEIDVTAPGGDSEQTPATPSGNGLVLSTLAGGGWGYMQGTSMASPHAAGVVALIRSTHPDWTAAQVKDAMATQADSLPCPKGYDTDGDGERDAQCNGGRTGAGFYGAGLIDALDAVRR